MGHVLGWACRRVNYAGLVCRWVDDGMCVAPHPTKTKEYPSLGRKSVYTDDTVVTVAVAEALFTDGVHSVGHISVVTSEWQLGELLRATDRSRQDSDDYLPLAATFASRLACSPRPVFLSRSK